MINHFWARITDSTDGGESYEEIIEHDQPDPFVDTWVILGGWRVAWAVLRGRYKLRVQVEANRAARQAVSQLISDRHDAWEGDDLQHVLGVADVMLATGEGPDVGVCAACGATGGQPADTSAYAWDTGYLCDDATCIEARSA